VLNLLDTLRAELELAILYITHDIASARYFGDEMLVIYAGEIVERGPSEEVTLRPAHPYAQLLVASAPDPDALGTILTSRTDGAKKLARSALSSIEGCRFAPRCPLADDRCRRDRPSLIKISAKRAAACWRLDIAAPALVAPASRTSSGKDPDMKT
jgi:peptide/nickel transport system ATP-binding protein